MPIATIITLLPTAVNAVQTLATIIANAQAAGRSTTTAEENAQLQTALTTLGQANADFNAEFADVLIRIFDTCGKYDIPLAKAMAAKMAYNETRAYRHGGKKL